MRGRSRRGQVAEPTEPGADLPALDPAREARRGAARYRRLLVAASLTLGTVAVVTFASGNNPVGAEPSPGQTVRASLTDNDSEAQFGGSDSQVSGNGRFDAFVSDSNMTAEDNGGVAQVYVRDLAAGTTVQISQQGHFTGDPPTPDEPVHPSGNPPSGRSFFPTISADGRFVAFLTGATDVVPNSGGTAQGFTLVVCDRGARDSTGAYPVDSAGIPQETCFWADDSNGGNLDISQAPHLSPDGSHLVWEDRVPLCGNQTVCPPRPNEVPLLSALAKDDAGNLTGVSPAQIVPDLSGIATGSDPTYFEAVVSNQNVAGLGATGVRVAFSAIVPVASAPPKLAVLATDMPQGATPATTVVKQVTAFVPQLNAPVRRPRAVNFTAEILGHPSISDDGNEVAFDHTQGDAPTPVGNEASFPPTAYVAFRSGTTWSPQVVSLDNDGQSKDRFGVQIAGAAPALSGDGRYVAFVTNSLNMDDGPAFIATTNGQYETADDACHLSAFNYSGAPNQPCSVVARDVLVDMSAASRLKGARVSACFDATQRGCDHNDFDADPQAVTNEFNSWGPLSLSTDGEKVGFQSQSDALVPNDNNFQEDFCNSENCPETYDGTDAFVRAWNPTVFTSDLPDMGSVRIGQSNSETLTITAQDFGPVTVESIAIKGGNGQFTVDQTGCAGVVLHEVDSCTVTITFAPNRVTPANSQESAQVTTTYLSDGAPGQVDNRVTGTGLPALQITDNHIVRTSVSTGNPGGQAPHGTRGTSQVSGNGDYDVFVSDDALGQVGPGEQTFSNIFVRNLRTNTTVQISLGADTEIPNGRAAIPNGTLPDGNSYDPSISADGRLVSFLTEADNIVPTDVNQATTYTVVVCDRDPDGNGVFDQSQAGFPDRMDYRCFNVEDELDTGGQQDPRLSPDGKHLVLSHSPDFADGDNNDEIDLYRLSAGKGSPLARPTFVTAIDPVFDAIPQPSTYTQPVVSNQGFFGDPSSVRVAFVEEGFSDTVVSGVVLTTVRGDGEFSHRVDRTPGGAAGAFIGDGNTRGRFAAVGNPSISDDGTKVALDYTDIDVGLAKSLVETINSAGVSTRGAFVGVDGAGIPARAADPALSGDGRYISYVTDSPQFDGHNAATPPGSSCLSFVNNNALRPRSQTDDAQCEVVARDLVEDASRAAQHMPLAPDALVTESGDQSRCAGTTVTINGGTCLGDDDSFDPSVDTIGSAVGFDSFADDLVANDTNATASSKRERHLSAQDAFVRFFFPTATLGQVNFGNVLLGQPSSRNVPIGINGFGPYQLGTPAVGGPNGGDFTVTPGTCQPLPGQVLHRGESCSITVTFKPGAPGTRTGTVTVSGKNNPTPTTITVTGFGVKKPPPRADISATPNPVNFGRDIPLHKPGRTRTVAVTNTGGQPLVITSVTAIDGSVPHAARDYSVDAGACEPLVAPGATCHISVTWIGTAVGSRRALLRILDNAPGGMTVITLQATVGAPKIIINPAVSRAGRVTTVTGTGFAPKRTVTIAFSKGSGTESATARTNRHGAFSTSLVIFTNAQVGPRTVHAGIDHVSKTISAEAPLLVVLGTLEEPGLVIRH